MIIVETRPSSAVHGADAASLLEYLGFGCAHVVGHPTGAAIALQLASDRPEIVRTLALLEPTLTGAASAAAFFEEAKPALATYGAGAREGAMASFLSIACSLDWAMCSTVIDKHVPGGAAQAMRDADNWFGSYVPALSTWQFGPKQATAVSQPVLSMLGQTASSGSWTATHCSTPGFRSSTIARFLASPTCCTCSARQRWRRASPSYWLRTR